MSQNVLEMDDGCGAVPFFPFLKFTISILKHNLDILDFFTAKLYLDERGLCEFSEMCRKMP